MGNKEREEIRIERYDERKIETRRRDMGDDRRGRVRVSRGSHPHWDTGRGRSGRGRWRRRRRRRRR